MRQNHQQGLDVDALMWKSQMVDDDVVGIREYRLEDRLAAVGHDGKVFDERHGDEKDCPSTNFRFFEAGDIVRHARFDSCLIPHSIVVGLLFKWLALVG
ncbi:uncharacterized protein N7500_005574 [Penicillium coprophilum]|uniref:uncharacterized protein n=1 Tax=Penicillium coprophilum TaxID=36646 RepID=UPI00239FBD8F|nr:uncharacterized protein N7500_005574 [Penicillium coprophilum]KAJ5163744.1 hypothetical protein N7500_005574 [Penicillium coprophilum]